MFHFHKITILIITIVCLFSCQKPGCTDIQALNYDEEATKNDNSCTYETNFSVEFSLKYNNSPFSKYDTLRFENNRFRLEKLKFYISNVYLDNFTSHDYTKDVHLFDIDNPSSQNVTFSAPEGNYTSLHFGLGLDETQNSTTPADYAVDHPLGLNQNTFWAMTPASYIFIMLEGKMDTSETTDFFPISYHLAHNDLYQIKNIDHDIVVNRSSENKLRININMLNLFDAIDLSQNLPHQSTASPLAVQLMSNFSSALEVE